MAERPGEKTREDQTERTPENKKGIQKNKMMEIQRQDSRSSITATSLQAELVARGAVLRAGLAAFRRRANVISTEQENLGGGDTAKELKELKAIGGYYPGNAVMLELTSKR